MGITRSIVQKQEAENIWTHEELAGGGRKLHKF